MKVEPKANKEDEPENSDKKDATVAMTHAKGEEVNPSTRMRNDYPKTYHYIIAHGMSVSYTHLTLPTKRIV